MSTQLAISVIMPAYNAEAYIRQAIDSILAQTFADFELVVVNDGSTDETAAILAGLKDGRLHVITQENLGIVAALNTGIAAAKAPLIARHDADDASEPTRLEKQLSYLNEHPKTVIVGSSMQTMDMSGTILHNHHVLLRDAELKQELLVRSPFAHGSVTFRKDAFVSAGGYQQEDWPTEDYGLWLRLASQGAFANLDEPLYLYRENEAGISHQNQTRQARSTEAVRQRAWQQRKQLIPKMIDAAAYTALPMGQFRIARIAQNLRAVGVKSLARFDLLTAIAIFRLVSGNRILRRKCVRLFLVTIGVRRGY